MTHDAANPFDAAGTERADRLDMWPPKGAAVGVGITGQYVGSDSFTVQDKDDAGNVTGSRQVTFIKLRSCVMFTPNAAGTGGNLTQALAMGVPVNADTRTKLDPDTLQPNTYLHIVLRERDERFNNMNRYTVKEITAATWDRIFKASCA